MTGDQWHGWSLRRAPGADATELLTHRLTIDGDVVALAGAPRVRSWLLLASDTRSPTREGIALALEGPHRAAVEPRRT